MPKHCTRRNPLSLGDHTRWPAYAAASIAGASGIAPSAEAAITHVDNIDVILNPGGVEGFFNYNGPLSDDDSINFTATRTTLIPGVTPTLGAASFNVIGGSFAGTINGTYQYVANLNFGDNLSTQNFVSSEGRLTGFGNPGNEFSDPGEFNYIGFQFDDDNDNTQFGWARVGVETVDPDALVLDNIITVFEYAFTDLGEAITVGQTVSDAFLLGDINGDGEVGILDFVILGDNFNTMGGAALGDGDINGDGNVDILDFVILGDNFGNSLGGGGVAAIPEPGSLGLLALGAVGLMGWRKHRNVAI